MEDIKNEVRQSQMQSSARESGATMNGFFADSVELEQKNQLAELAKDSYESNEEKPVSDKSDEDEDFQGSSFQVTKQPADQEVNIEDF